MKLAHWLTLFVVLLVAVAIADDWRKRESPAAIAARDTMRIIVYQRDTVRDTIRVREKARQHWDTVVRNVSDTQVVIQRERPETVTVAAEIVQRDRSKDSLLSSLYVDRRLDSLWHIQDAELPHKPLRKVNLGVAAGWGCNGKGCGPGFTVGVTWRP